MIRRAGPGRPRAYASLAVNSALFVFLLCFNCKLPPNLIV